MNESTATEELAYELQPELFRADAAMRERVMEVVSRIRLNASTQSDPHAKARDELVAQAFKRQLPFKPALDVMVAWFRSQWEEYESKVKKSLPVMRSRGVGIILSEAEKLGVTMVVIEPEQVTAPKGSLFDSL